MSFPVFFDTCSLFGEIVNDLVLRLAEERFFTPDYAYLLQRCGLPRFAERLYPILDALYERS
ncbi:PIN domain-containing protein [Bifidobacterium ramosum]|uniref:Aminotransferase n=1 Tax=Bifidobacterium ramosum TaxID=1798158 RepID=A0A6L4X2U7_9BIFI|nr:aminotransferase [Bifidobacterium ramosum]KAB8289240.1 PIN domain-containing protein [Bifidobacterium ramosum]NEG70946.1 aminotransferase [Bifidobacterium ramosum]